MLKSVIRFPDIGGKTLEKIIQYLHYKDKYSNSTTRIPEFQIEPDEVGAHTIGGGFFKALHLV